MAKKVNADGSTAVAEAPAKDETANQTVTSPEPVVDKVVDEKAVEEVSERIAGAIRKKVIDGVKDGLRSAFGADEATPLSEVAEKELTENVPEDEQPTIRAMLDKLPGEAQEWWVKTYADAKSYASSQKDISDPKEYAGKTAWASVERRYEKANSHWQLKKASMTFNASTGKWVVDSPKFMEPIALVKKADAEAVFEAVADASAPTVKVTEDKKFEITHKDWKEPVVAASAEEATDITDRKLVDEGWSNEEAKNKAEELVDSAQKETVMASVTVKADTAQNTKGGHTGQLVTGVAPKTEGISQGKKPKDTQPDVPGHATTEAPAVDATPAAEKTPGQATYEKEAMQHDKLINQMKSKHGLMKDVSDAINYIGGAAVEAALKDIKAQVKVFADMTPEAKDFVSKKISEYVDEGVAQDQAIAKAHGAAKEAGYDIPEASK